MKKIFMTCFLIGFTGTGCFKKDALDQFKVDGEPQSVYGALVLYKEVVCRERMPTNGAVYNLQERLEVLVPGLRDRPQDEFVAKIEKVLQNIEGVFVEKYGSDPVRLCVAARKSVMEALENHPEFETFK